MFESTTLLLLWIFCTYFTVQIILGIIDGLAEVNKDLDEKLQTHLNDIIHRVRVEDHDGVYYWYDNDDGEFLAQGASDSEIINNLKSRFPAHIFYLPTNHFISAKHDWVPTLGPDYLPTRIDSIIQK